MTKKNFKRIAEIIASEKERVMHERTYPERAATIYCIAMDLAEYFAEINSKFEMREFMKACGFKN